MNNKNGECETKPCEYRIERTRFYNGMLLTDEHLRTEQAYHRDALRRLTRYIFGSGVICGLEIEQVTGAGLCIRIHPGVALDCCGNLIEVCKCITLNLAKECEKKFPDDCLPPPPQQQDPIKKYLVLRYIERPEDPEPVLTPSDDCTPPDEKPRCQHSKIREGYCVELWDDCPCPDPPADDKTLTQTLNDRRKEQVEAIKNRENAAQLAGVQVPPQAPNYYVQTPHSCFPCGCCENAVGLAYVEIDCVNKTLTIDQTKCRRQVITPDFLRWVLLKSVTKYRSDEMNSVYLRMDRSVANLATAVDEVNLNSVYVRELLKKVDGLDKRLKKVESSKRAQSPP